MSANPYAAPTTELGEPIDGLSESHELASRMSRLGATFIDGLAIVPAYIPMIVGMAGAEEGDATGMAIGGAITGLLALGYLVYQLMQLSKTNQTLGKKIMGIRIRGTDGGHVSLGRIFLRRGLLVGLLGAIPMVGPIISLVDNLMIFRADQRCLHDPFAGTIVTKV